MEKSTSVCWWHNWALACRLRWEQGHNNVGHEAFLWYNSFAIKKNNNNKKKQSKQQKATTKCRGKSTKKFKKEKSDGSICCVYTFTNFYFLMWSVHWTLLFSSFFWLKVSKDSFFFFNGQKSLLTVEEEEEEQGVVLNNSTSTERQWAESLSRWTCKTNGLKSHTHPKLLIALDLHSAAVQQWRLPHCEVEPLLMETVTQTWQSVCTVGSGIHINSQNSEQRRIK